MRMRITIRMTMKARRRMWSKRSRFEVLKKQIFKIIKWKIKNLSKCAAVPMTTDRSSSKSGIYPISKSYWRA
jgi:hypothetical protein